MYCQTHFLLSIIMILSSCCLHRTRAFLIASNKVHPMKKFLATQYTIACHGMDPAVLQKTVTKHCEHFPLYLSKKPIAAHNKEAYANLQKQLAGNVNPLILDSGCGTGRSTIRLRRMYPDHTIIGVDRSLVRLSKNGVYRQQSCDLVEHDDSNVFFVRAELCDFWRLCLDNPIGHIQKHFILYPNPYPKAKRFQNRWYAHPGFPLIRQIGGDEIVIRSNWKAYLDDFSTAIAIAEELEGIQPIYDSSKPMILDPKEDALTNFEKKFFDAGEIAYELRLKARKE